MQIIWISAIIFIFLLLLIIFLFLFLKTKYKKYYEELGEFLQSEPYNDAKTTLRTIDINLKKIEYNIVDELKEQNITNIEENEELNQIKSDKEHFAHIQIKIEDKLSDLKKLRFKGLESLKIGKLWKVHKNIVEIKKIKWQINKMSKDVHEKSKKYIDEIQEINNVLWSYRKIGKNIEKILKSWILLENIPKEFQLEIKKKIEKIKKINDDLSNSLNKQKTKEAKKNFLKYKEELFNVYRFGNYIDQFINSIFIDSQNLFEKLEKFLDKTKQRMNSSLSFLEIEKYLENANNLHKTAVQNFMEFKIEETRESIKEYYNLLSDINVIVNSELTAFNFINDSFRSEQLDKFYQDVSIKFINIEKEVEAAISIDHIYFKWLEDDLSKLGKIINDLNDLKKKIESEKKDSEISNLSKQYRYKTYVYLIKSFNEIYYNIKNEINIFYSEGFSSRLIFKRVKKLLLQLNNSVKENKIKLNEDEKSLIKEIELERIFIDNKILNKSANESELTTLINNLQKKVSLYVKTIGKKLFIVKIYSHINKKYSYRRWNNLQIHRNFSDSEQYFVNGEYYNSLKLIISTIESGEN